MNLNRFTNSFMVKNNELENYSFNLVHYFLARQNYSIFNFEEKILENFNHDYYNIVYIYSSPLINDVNIDTFLEKLTIMKKKLKKNFFLFNQRILVIATNCTLNMSKIEIPENIDVINATDKHNLSSNSIIHQVYPDLVEFPLNLDLPTLSLKLNALSVAYAKKLSVIFNKHQYMINTILSSLLIFIFGYHLFSPYLKLPNILDYIILTRQGILKHQYYSFITNNLYTIDFIGLMISLLLILFFGVRLEKIYGSLRFLGIILLSLLLSNTVLFAFVQLERYPFGFTSIVYTYVGSFVYVVFLFRRFLAYIIKRFIYLTLFLLMMTLIFGGKIDLITFIGSLLAGFISSFIIGIPNAKNGDFKHRIIAFIFTGILIVLCIIIGLK